MRESPAARAHGVSSAEKRAALLAEDEDARARDLRQRLVVLKGALSRGAAPALAPRELRAPGVRSVRRQMDRILESVDFDAPPRSREFLRFVVEQALGGHGQTITQAAIAVEVFGRGDDFDPLVDPIVRIQAGRLRRSLERYYFLSGKDDPVRIDLPKGSYLPLFRAAAVAGSARPAEEPLGAAVSADPARARMEDGWPSVAVGGFEAVRPVSTEIATEVTDEVALEIGRYAGVRVVRQGGHARGPSAPNGARFVLEGRLRGEGRNLTISARLLDQATGQQVWADNYGTVARGEGWSGAPADVARVIAARVAAEEGVVVQVLAAERRRLRSATPTVYDAILRSFELFLGGNPEALGPTAEALRRAVECEPECGLAWTRLARLYLVNYSLEVAPAATSIDDALTFAHQGVRMDPASRSARCILAAALLVKGELLAARSELEHALRSSPGSLVYLETIGLLLTLVGDWERGQSLSRSALERNPHCLPYVLFGTWADALRRGEIAQAYQAAVEYRDAGVFWRPAMRASCLGLLGRTAEARSEVAELLSRKPDFRARGRLLIGHYVKFPEVAGPLVDGLARAGLKLA